jgi:hypothetical protein
MIDRDSAGEDALKSMETRRKEAENALRRHLRAMRADGKRLRRLEAHLDRQIAGPPTVADLLRALVARIRRFAGGTNGTRPE